MSNKTPFYFREPNEAWRRYQRIWERHQLGETYISIAREMGITPPRVRQMAAQWMRRLRLLDKYGGGWSGG